MSYKVELNCEAIHTWFGLSYASYLVLPRVVMDATPNEWQEKMVELLGELNDTFDWFPKDAGSYWVKLRDEKGRFMHDPLCNYRHNNIEHLRIKATS